MSQREKYAFHVEKQSFICSTGDVNAEFVSKEFVKNV
jgi:hypothetical protein